MSASPAQIPSLISSIVLDSIEELVVLIDRDGNRVYVSPSYQRVLGDSAMMGSNSLESVHPDDRERIRALLSQVVSRGRGERAEYRYVIADGSVRVVESQSTPVFDANHVVSYVLVVSRDVTDAREQERQSRAFERKLFEATQHRLQSLIETANDAFLTIDQSSLIIEWNPAAVRMFGWTRREALGRRLDALLIPPEHHDVHRAGMERLLATGVSPVFNQHVELEAMQRSGERLSVDLWIWPAAESGSGRRTFSAFIRDISERKMREQETQRMLDRERELNDLKSRFITMTSHEFRTPLATILSSIELFEHYQDKLTEKDRLELIESIKRAVKRSTTMLDDILLIGKTDAGRTDFRPEYKSMTAFCEQLVDEFGMVLPDGIRIEFSVEGDDMAWFDPKLLHVTLGNLLSNAIKYSSAPSDIAFRASLADNTAQFVIRDHGIGIPEEEMSHLFDSFHRASNVGNRPGTGLGLAIVRRAVDLQGGTIEVVSRLGEGSTFSVFLPVGDAGAEL